ncbi:MAG: sulfatase [Rhodothermaceae bacterium]|nr:sulfatase [Rhodothermaceae bacterium]
MHRLPLFLILIASFLYLPGCETTTSSEPQQPNIIFIFTDDHAPHAVGAYGGPLAALDPTPNMDRLAEEGMLFRNAFVTNSICAPSRAVILTGLHSHLNSVPTNREPFDSTQVTFPKLLQQAGYQTAMIGKWHLKTEPTGFDHWEVLPGQGHYYNPDFRTPEGRVQETGYVTDIITDKVLDWLQSDRDESKPFMVMYQHKAPHRRWSPGLDHLSTYDDVAIPEPATLFDDYEGRTSAAKTQEMEIGRHMDFNWDLKVRQRPDSNRINLFNRAEELYYRMNEEQREAWDAVYEPKNQLLMDEDPTGDELLRWKYQRYLKDYLRVIRSVDDNLGRLLDYLDESGLDENTVVIYNSDQGFYLGDHGWYDKRWMYEESLRTPLIIRWPGVVQPGSENTDLVQNLDLAQTFLGIADVEEDPSMQGLSLEPLLRGESPADWRDAIYYQYYEYPGPHMVERHYGVRTDRHKLIYYYNIDEWELFDLESDPDELQSVHDSPDYAEVREELLQRLTELRTQYRVPEEEAMP